MVTFTMELLYSLANGIELLASPSKHLALVPVISGLFSMLTLGQSPKPSDNITSPCSRCTKQSKPRHTPSLGDFGIYFRLSSSIIDVWECRIDCQSCRL